MPQLLSNATTQAAGAASTWGGGPGSFEVSGTLNGSTVTLQAKALDGSFYDVPNTASTVGGTKAFNLAPGQIRANVTVAAPTSAYAAAWRTRNP